MINRIPFIRNLNPSLAHPGLQPQRIVRRHFSAAILSTVRRRLWRLTNRCGQIAPSLSPVRDGGLRGGTSPGAVSTAGWPARTVAARLHSSNSIRAASAYDHTGHALPHRASCRACCHPCHFCRERCHSPCHPCRFCRDPCHFCRALAMARPTTPLEFPVRAQNTPIHHQKAAKTAMLTTPVNIAPNIPGSPCRHRPDWYTHSSLRFLRFLRSSVFVLVPGGQAVRTPQSSALGGVPSNEPAGGCEVCGDMGGTSGKVIATDVPRPGTLVMRMRL